MNFKFLNPASFNDEINGYKAEWEKIRDFVNDRYQESVALR